MKIFVYIVRSVVLENVTLDEAVRIFRLVPAQFDGPDGVVQFVPDDLALDIVGEFCPLIKNIIN